MTSSAKPSTLSSTAGFKVLLPWLVSAVVLVLVLSAVAWSQTHLGRVALWSGYSLLLVMLALSLFHIRKRLSMIPLGRAYWWQKLHVAFGFLSIALYIVHVDGWWPLGGYEQWLAIFFYVAVVSGILGYLMQSIIPGRLTETQDEIILERVNDVIADLRDEARACVERSLAETQTNTISRFYIETFDRYFRRPRFVLNHLLGGRFAEHWLANQFDALAHYCDATEMTFVDELHELALTKARVDSHYAHMLLLKLWLFVHIPAVVGLVLLIGWHWLLVNIYAL